ncbi:MAG TPA: hypothetical protein VF095_02185 [Bacillota bacterium]
MSLFTVPALANSGANGGWTEGEGYWTNTIDTKYGVFSKPSSHQGWKQKSGKKYRAVGTTHWKNKRHYTRAQMVSRIFGIVHADSGRVWGTGTTEARSGWTKNYTARTFYGSN